MKKTEIGGWRFERMVRRIIRRTKGWSVGEMKADFNDFPEAQTAELAWIRKELRRVPEILVLDELEKSQKKG